MTNTNDLREMIALADRLVEQTELNLSDVNEVRNYLNKDSELHHEAAKALRASASRADFDAGRVAGQRDMQAALSGLIEGCVLEFNEKGAGGFALARLRDAQLAIASLPLNVESGEDQR